MFSDGSFTPEELVVAAVAAKLTAMALTDHDTTAGLPRFLAAAAAASLRGITGVEVSADHHPARCICSAIFSILPTLVCSRIWPGCVPAARSEITRFWASSRLGCS